MTNNKQYTKLVLHVSEELNQRIQDAAAKNKLSTGSVIREALVKYLDDSEKGKK
jgi:hypothetical protein